MTDDGRYDAITMFLVVHEILPELKDRVLASAARALAPGGSLVIFDEAYPETDATMRTMPSRFSAVAQWFELTWGNRIAHGERIARSLHAGRASPRGRDDLQPLHDPRRSETRLRPDRRPRLDETPAAVAQVQRDRRDLGTRREFRAALWRGPGLA